VNSTERPDSTPDRSLIYRSHLAGPERDPRLAAILVPWDSIRIASSRRNRRTTWWSAPRCSSLRVSFSGRSSA